MNPSSLLQIGSDKAGSEWFAHAHQTIELIKQIRAICKKKKLLPSMIFLALDANNDGRITFTEMKKGLKQVMPTRFTADEYRMIYNSFDSDSDGCIDFHELSDAFDTRKDVNVGIRAPKLMDAYQLPKGDGSPPNMRSEDYQYDGQMKNNCRHGQGQCFWDNGDAFVGEFFMGGMLKGQYRRADGSFFDGEWHTGKMYKGMWSPIKYPNGDEYSGDWVNGIDRSNTKTCHPGKSEYGRRQGTGVLNKDNGDIFRGKFTDDDMNLGIYEYAAENGDTRGSAEELKQLVRESLKQLKEVGKEWKDLEAKELAEKVIYLKQQLTRNCVSSETLFALMDDDRSNTINFKEFSNGLAAVGFRPTPNLTTMRKLYDEFDTNKDSSVSFTELMDTLGLQEAENAAATETNVGELKKRLEKQNGVPPVEVVYKGTFRAELPYKGVTVMSDGSSFKGFYRSGKPCSGIWFANTYHKVPINRTHSMEPMAHAYTGDWKENCEHGVGLLEREDGAVFNGIFKQGLPWKGVWTNMEFVMDDPDDCGIYNGQWDHGQAFGTGTLVYQNDDVYDGEWELNKLHGDGCIHYHYKGVYTGRFVHGNKYDGEVDSLKYKDQYGSWGMLGPVRVAHGSVYGDATLTYFGSDLCPEGGTFIGELAHNQVWNGEWVNYVEASNPTVYNGPCVKGKMHGFGSLAYPNGDFYEGMFDSGVRSGVGRCTYADGSVFSGTWEGDTCAGCTDRDLSRGRIGEWTGAQQSHINGVKQM